MDPGVPGEKSDLRWKQLFFKALVLLILPDLSTSHVTWPGLPQEVLLAWPSGPRKTGVRRGRLFIGL